MGHVDRIRKLFLASVPDAAFFLHRLEVVIGDLTNGSTAAPAAVVIPPDSDFLWLGNLITPHPDQSNDATGPAGFATLMRIEMDDRPRQFGRHRDQATDAPAGWIPLMNVCGRGRMPFLWSWPIHLKARERVRFNFVHRGSVDLLAARLTLLGVRIVHERQDREDAA